MRIRPWLMLSLPVLLGACASTDQNEPIAYQQPPPRSMYRPLRQRPPAVAAPEPQVAQRSAPRPPAPTEAWPPASGRISKRWKTIVIHHSATDRGGAATFDKFHKGKGWDELGYHFVIGNGSDTPDGFIEAGSRWHKQKHGAHCKTPNQYYNEHGIGICLVGDFTERRPSARQMAALTRLVNYLSYACNIPPGMVTTHGHVNPKTKCPGHLFSLGALRARMGGPGLASSVGR